MPKVRYLLLAAAIHVALTVGIFLTGHFQLLPGTFDQNGIGLTFAIDGATYRNLSASLATELQTNGFAAWANARAPLHCKLYALSFAVFGKFLGHNILAAEPLNLFYYLAILGCIYFLGREIFNAQAGLLAAAIIAVWPSFLLHSTQLIRDPLSIFCLLALLGVLVLLLGREFPWPKAIALGVVGALSASLFWLARGNMWNIILVAIAIALVMLVFRMVQRKKFIAANAFALLLITIAVLLVPSRFESATLPGMRPPATHLAIPSTSQPAPVEGIWATTIKQLATRRGGFRFSTSQASNIDSDVRFNDVGDICKYLPRAAVIGFFAPFPRMWIEAGSFGRAGRLLSGLETLVMYCLYLPVIFCVWRERRNLRMWLLLLVATIGMVGLGLVVVNAGALYRIRYVFWMMLIVLAAQGIRHFTVLRTTLTKS